MGVRTKMFVKYLVFVRCDGFGYGFRGGFILVIGAFYFGVLFYICFLFMESFLFRRVVFFYACFCNNVIDRCRFGKVVLFLSRVVGGG